MKLNDIWNRRMSKLLFFSDNVSFAQAFWRWRPEWRKILRGRGPRATTGFSILRCNSCLTSLWSHHCDPYWWGDSVFAEKWHVLHAQIYSECPCLQFSVFFSFTSENSSKKLTCCTIFKNLIFVFTCLQMWWRRQKPSLS